MARGWTFTALVGGALALNLAALGTSPAHAGRHSYRVRIDSSPPGATVYLDSKDGDPLGKTPYTGKIDSGIHTLIVERDGYVSSVQDVTIKRTHRVQHFTIELSKVDLATIHVVPGKGQEAIKGARVLVDGEEQGNVPDWLKVPAGPHQVQVIKEGYKPFETWVEVSDGQKMTVKAELVPTDGGGKAAAANDAHDDGDHGGGTALADAAGDDGDEDGDSDGGGDGDGDGDGDPEAGLEGGAGAAHSHRTVPIISLGAAVELAGRRFRYQGSAQGLPYDAGGRPLVRVRLELDPLASASSKLLSGWVFTGSYARATPFSSQATLNNMTVKVPTTWTEWDLAAGYRLRFSQGSYFGAEVGYGNHGFTFKFNSDTMALKDRVPAVDYKFISLGADLRLGFAKRLAMLLSGGTRLVSDTGALGQSVDKTDVSAFQVEAGLAMSFTDSIEMRLAGRYEQFQHTFSTSAGSALQADSGTDQFFGALLALLYNY